MILAFNGGNTNICIGAYKDDILVWTAELSTTNNRTVHEIIINLKNIFSLYDANVSKVEGGIISTVTPFLTSILADAFKMLFNKIPFVVGPGIKTGLDIITDNPAELGSDIVTCAVAAVAKYEKSIIIVYMGTAITISVINENSQYIGCAISPGVVLSVDALSSKAAQLPFIDIKKPKKVISTNTTDCMESGIFYGTISLIEGMIDKMEKEIESKCTVVITGHTSKVIYPFINREVIYDETLVFDGLHILYKKNKRNS